MDVGLTRCLSKHLDSISHEFHGVGFVSVVVGLQGDVAEEISILLEVDSPRFMDCSCADVFVAKHSGVGLSGAELWDVCVACSQFVNIGDDMGLSRFVAKAVEKGVFAVEHTDGFIENFLADHENADIQARFLPLVDSLPTVVYGNGLVGYKEAAINPLSNLTGKIKQTAFLGRLRLVSERGLGSGLTPS